MKVFKSVPTSDSFFAHRVHVIRQQGQLKLQLLQDGKYPGFAIAIVETRWFECLSSIYG